MLLPFRHRRLKAYYVSIMVPGTGKRVVKWGIRADLMEFMVSGVTD